MHHAAQMVNVYFIVLWDIQLLVTEHGGKALWELNLEDLRYLAPNP